LNRLRFHKVSTLSAAALVYHPHGEKSNEDVITSEGQYWSNNICTVVPQGNFGSIRGDRPGAGRYLEAKISEYLIDCFFDDFYKYCVPMKDNYTGERVEPFFLPAKYPHALFNPQFSGIGYGLSSNIPSFNVAEVLKATIKLIKNQNSNIMLIPDIPTGADIIDEGLFEEINKTGIGKLTMRATAEIDHNKNIIRFTSLPLQTSSMQIINKIIEMRKKGEFGEIIDITDYSKLGETDLRFILRSDANPDKVLKKLYKRGTGLKNTFPVCIKLIDDFRESDYGVKDFLLEWIEYRRDVVRSMFSNDLIQTMEKQHMNEVLLFVFSETNAEETLKICKNAASRKDTIEKLMKKYKITSLQAATIADMRLYHFNKDTYARYKEEKKQLAEDVDRITKTLDDESLIDDFIIKQLEEGIKKYGHPRKSMIVKDDNSDIEQVPDTNHLVAITETGFIKKVNLEETNVIGEVGKHKDNFSIIQINNREDILVIDSTGNAIRIPVSSFPDMTVDDIGVEISRYFKCNGKIISVLKLPDPKMLKDKNNSICISLVTKQGFAKRIKLSEFKGISEPRSSITLNEGDEVVAALFTLENSSNDIIIFTNLGRGIRIDINELKVYGRAAKGLKQLTLQDGEYVTNANKVDPSKKALFYITSAGRAKITDVKYFPVMTRNEESLQLITLEGNETLLYVASVNHKKDIIRVYFKNADPVDFNLSELKVATRIAKGEKVIKVPRGDVVVSVKVFTDNK
jgi:DNA gyrase subunit A